jgi:GST-like protein
MDTVLYGKKGSGSAAIEIALALAGVAWRQVETATWEKNAAYDDLLKANPLGQVPTLVLPDGTVLSECAAILIHLGLAHPASGLLPRDAAPRARVLRGLVYVAANCYAAIGIIDYPERWTLPADDGATNDRVRAGARARLHGYWTTFADVFGDALFADAAAPNALGLLAAVVSTWSGARAHLAKHRPALHDTLLRIEAHPAVAPVFARHWPGG